MIKRLSSLISKIIVITAVILAVTALLLNHFIDSRVNAPLSIDRPLLYSVEKGQYAHFVINRLAEQGLLASPLAFKAKLKLSPDLADIKSGTYELLPGMTGTDLFSMLSYGQEKQFSLSLVEGLRWKEWLAKLNDTPHLVPLSAQEASSMGPFEGGAIEGWLLPETYNFTSGTTAREIVDRAYQSMQEYLAEQWHIRAVDLPYDTPYEALIMASIIEKETGVASERPRIAGVFVNRLRQNMRLQTDPTVIYGMGDDFDGDIRRKDLRTPTPYNTYVIKGLPPTPIAMPGKKAIDAALNPMATEELYFVAKGDGSHYFSKTLSEHNAAVRKYQLKK